MLQVSQGLCRNSFQGEIIALKFHCPPKMSPVNKKNLVSKQRLFKDLRPCNLVMFVNNHCHTSLNHYHICNVVCVGLLYSKINTNYYYYYYLCLSMLQQRDNNHIKKKNRIFLQWLKCCGESSYPSLSSNWNSVV